MANLDRGQSPSEKHKEGAAQLAELNEQIKKHSEQVAKKHEEAKEVVEEIESLADLEIAAVIGNDEGYTPYGTPEWYEQEYVKQLPPPLRSLISPDARNEIEKLVKPMDIGDILLAQAEQLVPVIRGSFYVSFRVLTTDEEIHVEDLVAGGSAISQKQAVSLINLYRLALSVTSIADDRLPEHRKKDGTVDPAVVQSRISRMRRQANPITVLMTTHLGWFDRRVYATLAGEALKNG